MYSRPNDHMKPSCSSSSITELLGALCDRSLSGVSWKRRALGGISREGFRRALKKCAYGSLLSKLFEDDTKGSASASSATANTPPKNKVLMICFDLRVAGCREEAEKLEEQLGMLPEGASSGLKEIDAVIELLVHLAGSAPPPPTSFSRDYMRRERPVLRRPQPWGYQSEELQRLEARAWGLVCGEEWGSLEGLCGTQRLMDGPPGTGMLALRTKLEAEERFERDTRMTLFGALQHTRTSDMDIRLDLPPVPSNIDVTGLAIRVPSSLDQSEDEGFQSASNMTPDSQSETSPIPDVDIWEALRTFEPGRRRCWESIGCPPGKRESLYLTEGGREAFDQLYRLWEGEMRVVSTATPSPLLPLPLDTQAQLVFDLLNVLIGVASTTFPLNQSVQFGVRPGVCVSGASPESVSRLLGELAQHGTHYLRLSRFSLQSADKKGLVFQVTPPTLTLLTIGFLFRKVGRQLRYLSELCCVDGPLGAGQATFPVGVKLLSYLYNEAQNNCSNENYPVLLSLLKSSCEPYTRFVSDWVYSGVFRDVYGEFMIQVNEEYLGCRDKHFWVQGYTLISKDVEDCVPIFLGHIGNDVYVCGKTINLLKICCPQHYICWSELPVPRIAVTFSLQEVEEIERDCAVYRGRMERVAKHSAVSREEQAQRAEEARQELINQVSLRLADEAKKRERFEELKQQLKQEQEWHSVAKRQEEDDFGFARELRDREKRLQALEQQLEQRARTELIDRYSRLSEEAARRERRALWQVQRMRLDEARAQFFMRDVQQTQAMLNKYPLGQERPPMEALPPVRSALKTAALEAPGPDPSEQRLAETPECDAVSPPAGASVLALPADPVLQPISSDLPEARPTAQLVDYDFSAPFSPLEGITGQAAVQSRPSRGSAAQLDLIRNHPSFSHIPIGENVSQFQDAFPKASPFGQASKSSFPLGQYIADEHQNTFKASVHGHPSQATVQLGDESGSMAINKQSEVSSVIEPVIEMGNLEGTVEGNDDMGKSVKAAKDDDAVDSPSTPPEQSGEDNGLRLGGIDPLDANTKPSTQDHRSDVQYKTGDDIPATDIHLSGARLNAGEPASDGVARQPSTDPLPSPNVHGHASDSGIEIGEHMSEVAAPLPSAGVHGHASDAHIKVGEDVAEFVDSFPTQNVHGHASDSHIKVGEDVAEFIAPLPTQNVHGHASDANIKVGENVAEFVDSFPTQNVHGHASDAHIKVGEDVAEFIAPLPTQNVHGHASDAHIKVGENVTEFVASFPTQNVHGHASDAHIKVGEHVSDVAAPFPAPSVHGHSSDAHIVIGENVSDVAAPLPSPGVHGHASDANIKVGGYVSNVPDERPRWSQHGHASDCALQPGCVASGAQPASAALPGSSYGHSSDSGLAAGCVVSGDEPKASPLPGGAHGHSSDSNLGIGCVVAKTEPLASPLPGSAYGHSSDSALGGGCVVAGAETQPAALPGSTFGHSSDSSLAVGCVVKDKDVLSQEKTGEHEDVEGSKSDGPGEQLSEFMGSWAAGLGLSPGERSEQEYLLALCAQYEVEQYEDCYNLMASSPECQLLKQVTRGPRGLPMDPAAVQLSEMVSLPVLIKQAVTTPLITHVSLVNKAVVDYFFVELGVERHFEALRHFLLMEDGEFAQSLSDLLFEKVKLLSKVLPSARCGTFMYLSISGKGHERSSWNKDECPLSTLERNTF
ncbi:Gamma-tubulin complex component 6 [Liparis tanakae]|uniref:Gamma-tubulin complex component 6 n=1 Tax=Liparis tanakae TaxID=230148 RepID=A0A4Z2ID49_9TELE|nr:Gamma-tubulin complex component 6 [Liparis tanakae]